MDFLPSDINHFATIARCRNLDREGKFQEALKLANVYYESGSGWHTNLPFVLLPQKETYALVHCCGFDGWIVDRLTSPL
jgi:hypothetical protein